MATIEVIAFIAIGVFCFTCLVLMVAAIFEGRANHGYNSDEFIRNDEAYLLTDVRRMKQIAELNRADKISGVDKNGH